MNISPRRNKLIALRKDKDWLQKDVVKNLNEKFDLKISESYYGMIEQGVRTPGLNVALSISMLFDTSPGEIFFGNENNKMLF
ncbi:helix-turn-helix transcriptional regulator [Viridibacillus arvi]|uniref:helix-turn-helix transcriptional regulator n=1 Tax=Viridibacillus arvi TaxID=263475 RepID=UPI003D06BDE6